MDQEIRMALTTLINGTFSSKDTERFREIYECLLNGVNGRADEYFILEDFKSYANAQEEVDKAYKDKTKWAKMAIINTAKSGKFSSDRTILEYANEIWNLKPVKF